MNGTGVKGTEERQPEVLPRVGAPLHDRVVVRRFEPGDKKGSIIIPDQAKEKSYEGEVVAVGPGRYAHEFGGLKRVPLDVRPGDRVVFGKYSGSEIVIDGESYLILREEEIHLILNRDFRIEDREFLDV